MPILTVKDLHKSYRKGFIPKSTQVLKGVNFSLEAASVTGFLGGNGAGKTTTIKCLLQLVFADHGEVLFFDQQPLSPEVKKRIGFLPERPYFYEYLSGIEFLKFYGEISLQKMATSELNERIHILLKKVDLLHAKDRKLRTYSKGMLQKIGLAQALIHRPEFIILDEPMAGLDPDGRFYISEIVKEVASEGTTVFFSSHLLNDVENLCDNLVVLKQGQVTFEGQTLDFVNQMGPSSTIRFLNQGLMSERRVKSIEEVNVELKSILDQGGQVVEVRHDRNLEEAFVKWGLR